MAAIPKTSRARYAPYGVMRALSRALVLGGLVVAGWLLGSGIGLAEENLGQPVTGPAQLASDPGGNDLTGKDPSVKDLSAKAAQSEGPQSEGPQSEGPQSEGPQSEGPQSEGESGASAVSPTVASAVMAVRSPVSAPWAVSVPWRSVAPLVKLGGAKKPIVGTAGVPSPLVRALAGRILVPLSRPIQHRAGVRSQAPNQEGAPLPPAQPAVRAAAAPAPVPTLGVPTGPTVLDRVPPAVPVHAAARTAQPSFRPSAPGDDPAAPNPLPSTTSAGMASGTGSGAGTKGAPDVAVHDRWATAGPAPLRRPRYLSVSDLPRSPAAQPGTSPD